MNLRILYTTDLRMIFRDKNTGALLNIRRDDYINDLMYFNEIIRVVGMNNSEKNKPLPPPRYECPYNAL
jgi:hypothetical protein